MVDLLEIVPAHLLARNDPQNGHDWADLKRRLWDLCEFEPRDGQVECIWHLLSGQRDVLFQAATGYGKSLIWQYTGLLCNQQARPLTIMVTPLTALTQQQIASLPAGHGLKGMALYAHNFTDDMLRQLVNEDFTHGMITLNSAKSVLMRADTYCIVCLGPEIAASRRFALGILQDESVRSRPIFLIVDEVHTAVQWVTFRKEMAKLGHFRQRLPPTTNVIGMSATLTAATKSALVEQGLFRPDTIFITTSTNRPEIYIELRPIFDKKIRWLDLRFLFPHSLRDSRELRKTIVFFNSRSDIRNFVKVAVRWLYAAGLEGDIASQAVKAYYAPLPQEEKDDLLSLFRDIDSPIRIMLATDAMGMGIELSSIEIVVQYGDEAILKSLNGVSTIAQRMGRAARKSGEQGHFVWLVPKWVLSRHGTGTASSLGNSLSVKEDGSFHQTKSDGVRWQNLHEIYRQLFTRCPRSEFLSFFHAGHSTRSSIIHQFRTPRVKCCSRCHPKEILILPNTLSVQEWQAAFTRTTEKMEDPSLWEVEKLLCLPPTMTLRGVGPYYSATVRCLREWRIQKVRALLLEAGCGMIDANNILSDEDIDRIAQMASFFMFSEDEGGHVLRHFLQHWEHVDKYCQEIRKLLRRVVPESDAQGARRHNFIRKDRTEQRNIYLQQGEAFQRRRDQTYGPLSTAQTGFYHKVGSITDKRSVPEPSRYAAITGDNSSTVIPSHYTHVLMPDDVSENCSQQRNQQDDLTQVTLNNIRRLSTPEDTSTFSTVNESSQDIVLTPLPRRHSGRRRSDTSGSSVGRPSSRHSQSDVGDAPEAFTTRSGRTSKSTPKATGHRQYLQ